MPQSQNEIQNNDSLIETYLNDHKNTLPAMAVLYDELKINLTINAADLDEAVENVIKENLEFKEMSFLQLKNSENFQNSLKEYLLKHPLISSKTNVMDETEILKSVIPKIHIKPNNKLANKITKDIVAEGEVGLIVSNKNAKKEVTTKVILDYDNNYVQFTGKEKYKPYDQEVQDGVVTLFVANESLFKANGFLFTPAMVYRAMNGLTESEYVSPQAIESVTKSLDKSRFIKTTIDYTEEAKLYNKDIQKTKYEGYLLAAEKVTAKIKDKEQEVYKLLRKPILYQYAQISGQVLTVPMKLLQTKSKVNSTEEVIVIRGYLLRQIEWIRSEKSNRSENITYKSIYEEIDVTKDFYNESMYKKKTHATRVHVKSILDEWQEQGYIKKYNDYKEGQTIKGITITP